MSTKLEIILLSVAVVSLLVLSGCKGEVDSSMPPALPDETGEGGSSSQSNAPPPLPSEQGSPGVLPPLPS